MAFKLICAEVISQDMDRDDALEYAAKRLKEIGADLSKIQQSQPATSATTGSKTLDPKSKDLNLSQVAPSNATPSNSKR